MNSNQKAYQHYVRLCFESDMKPLSFEGWLSLTKGEIPDEVLQK
jgi:hypothetical protein